MLALYNVNVEASSVLVNLNQDIGWFDSSSYSFSGLVVRDPDFTSAASLLGSTVSTNLSGRDDSRAICGADYIGFGWHGLTASGNASFYVEQIISEVKVPEPGTLSLLCVAFLAFAARRRRSLTSACLSHTFW
jgi:hypothetical protein